MLKPEVLSPAGNMDSLTAAVRAGADAVYLGLTDFNARRNAGNFDEESLFSAVRYCHIRGVRVHLALNTMIKDDELPRALAAAKTAYAAGVDAAIVADLGLARLLREKLPNLPLHASTQLTAHSPSALDTLCGLGFTRAVASREMSRRELEVFCERARKLNIEVETFVHGALCMSMSGQCYLSAMLGGRSGNRGLCAGPCRLPFSAPGGTGYDLSLKDLCLFYHVKDLAALGVSSLKIEGRMKRPEYVAASTAACRAAVDGEDFSGLLELLRSAFSRSGFTSGYFDGSLGRDMFGVRTKEDKALFSSAEGKIHELYRAERKAVPLSGRLTVEKEKPVAFFVSDGINSCEIFAPPPEAALTRPLTDDLAKEQLSRTGGTPFYFSSVSAQIGENLSVSTGALRSLRRDALEKIENLRAVKRDAPETDYSPPDPVVRKKRERKFIARFSNASQIPNDLSGLCCAVFPAELDPPSLSLPVIPELPRAIISEEKLLSRLEVWRKSGASHAFCGNIAEIPLCRKAGLSPVLDFSFNIFNSEAIAAARDLGAAACVASIELRHENINKLRSILPLGVLAYGYLPLMLTRNCPLKNGSSCGECGGFITDRLGKRFRICCRGGYSEILNPVALSLSDCLSDFSADFFILRFTDEPADRCRVIINDYICSAPARGECTRGLYYRGVE